MVLGSILTVIGDYGNLYSGLFDFELPKPVAHFMRMPCTFAAIPICIVSGTP